MYKRQVLPLDQPTVTLDSLGEGPGHWSKEQRGITLDEEDRVALPRRLTEVNEDFGFLVVTRPLITPEVNLPCYNEAQGIPQQPRNQIQNVISGLQSTGVSHEKVAANIDLLRPDRQSLYSLCLSNGTNNADFADAQYRLDTLKAFTDLARVSNLKSITVGLDMNAYYHLSDSNLNHRWDYANFIFLYHEIYDAIKEVNSEIQVCLLYTSPSPRD